MSEEDLNPAKHAADHPEVSDTQAEPVTDAVPADPSGEESADSIADESGADDVAATDPAGEVEGNLPPAVADPDPGSDGDDDDRGEIVQQSPAEPFSRSRVEVPMGHSAGYISTSFGVNLTPKAAENLSRLLIGLELAGEPVRDGSAAINHLLELL